MQSPCKASSKGEGWQGCAHERTYIGIISAGEGGHELVRVGRLCCLDDLRLCRMVSAKQDVLPDAGKRRKRGGKVSNETTWRGWKGKRIRRETNVIPSLPILFCSIEPWMTSMLASSIERGLHSSLPYGITSFHIISCIHLSGCCLKYWGHWTAFGQHSSRTQRGHHPTMRCHTPHGGSQ